MFLVCFGGCGNTKGNTASHASHIDGLVGCGLGSSVVQKDSETAWQVWNPGPDTLQQVGRSLGLVQHLGCPWLETGEERMTWLVAICCW